MRKIVDYEVMKSEDDFELVKLINGMMKGGWVPFGGISISPKAQESRTMLYAQAMVKYEDDET